MKKYIFLLVALIVFCINNSSVYADVLPDTVQSRIDWAESNGYHYLLLQDPMYRDYFDEYFYNLYIAQEDIGESIVYFEGAEKKVRTRDSNTNIHLYTYAEASPVSYSESYYPDSTSYVDLALKSGDISQANMYAQTNFNITYLDYPTDIKLAKTTTDTQIPMDEWPRAPFDPMMTYLYLYDFYYKIDGEIYVTMATTPFRAVLGFPEQGYFWITTDYRFVPSTGKYTPVYDFKLVNGEWELYGVSERFDGHPNSQFFCMSHDDYSYSEGYSRFNYDEFLKSSHDIYSYSELIYPANLGSDGNSEYYINVLTPKDNSQHTSSTLIYEIVFRYPTDLAGEYYPDISGISNYTILEQDYVIDEQLDVIEGYMVIEYATPRGYTDMTASWYYDEGSLVKTVTTNMITDFVDSDGDGLDDETGLSREDFEITVNATSFTNKFVSKLQLNVLTGTMQKFTLMTTEKGEAPIFTIDLNALYTTSVGVLSPDMLASNPFALEPYVLFDFGMLENYSFMGYTVIDYFRMLEGTFMIFYTFLYVYRKVYPDKVVS